MSDHGGPGGGSGTAPGVRDLEPRIAALREACASTPGVTSLLVFGSTTRAAAHRRDAWSDLDFNVFLAPEAAADLARTWAFLPERDRIVLTAREGENGGVALYEDGLVAEFGAGPAWVVRDPDREVLLDGGDVVTQPPPALPDPRDQIGLFLVKLVIGVGRIRRGERIVGGALVRTYALTPLCEALRQRLAPDLPRNPFDPLRRIETALPRVAARIGDLLDGEVEACARGLLVLAREELEPGWEDFPSRAFDVAARALGWAD
ncbi:hypothetical protein EDD28_0248 [Salana multivorans]|uniref:Nucleotidyltransferase-like protein n=1 Tax=Salana multivorans TaxID=120377 RepID=A0A3N2D7C2_9MICO|nr:hypothetical protein [Salana multivorans]ROR95686.1 hypothetical protein EDD28_0248 [Salana multivorans]